MLCAIGWHDSFDILCRRKHVPPLPILREYNVVLDNSHPPLIIIRNMLFSGKAGKESCHPMAP
jgi:hypothetical protein